MCKKLHLCAFMQENGDNFMKPISASILKYNSTPIKPVSFKGLTPVSYVVVDGHTETDKKIVDEVTSQLVKQIRLGKPEDEHLRKALHTATGDSSLAQAFQRIKKMDKYLITGQDAVDLNNIWSASKKNMQQKASEASNFVKKLFAKITPHKLTIVAEKMNVKGKIKYVIKNLYTTLY